MSIRVGQCGASSLGGGCGRTQDRVSAAAGRQTEEKAFVGLVWSQRR